MNPRAGRNRRMMALHNAELAGRQAYRDGKPNLHPYRDKKIRGAVVELARSWVRGWEEASQDVVESDCESGLRSKS